MATTINLTSVGLQICMCTYVRTSWSNSTYATVKIITTLNMMTSNLPVRAGVPNIPEPACSGKGNMLVSQWNALASTAVIFQICIGKHI